MADGTIGVAQAATPDRQVDNEVIGSAYRQRVRVGGVALADLAGCDAANGLDVDVTRVTGTVTVDQLRPATSAVTSVSASASNVTLKASNTGRYGLSIYNDSTANLFVKLGATASATSFTQRVAGGGAYEVPFGYTGIVDGIWESATGAARVTEVTA